MASERKREIKRRRHRKDKIKKLRAQLAEAKNKAEKEKIIAKIRESQSKSACRIKGQKREQALPFFNYFRSICGTL